MKRLGFVALTAATGLFVAAVAAQQPAPNEGQAQAGPRLKIDRDVEFGRAVGQSLKLDMYRQDPVQTPSPAVIWIHGTEGAMTSRSPSPAAALVTPGFAVAAIDYRTAGGATLSDQVADAKAAVRWLRTNAKTYNIDPAKIGVMGWGRGGEIAALLGTAGDVPALEGQSGMAGPSSHVQAVVDLAGPVDAGPVNPVAYVTKDDAPFLIVHGTADAKVPTRQSQALVSALKVAGVNSTLDLQIGAGHDVGELLSATEMQTITSFLNQQLRGLRTAGGLSNYLSTASRWGRTAASNTPRSFPTCLRRWRSRWGVRTS